MGLLQWLLASKLTPEPSVSVCICVFVDECIQAFWGMSGQSLLTDCVCSCGLIRLCVCVFVLQRHMAMRQYNLEAMFGLNKWPSICLKVPDYVGVHLYSDTARYGFSDSVNLTLTVTLFPCLIHVSGLIVNHQCISFQGKKIHVIYYQNALGFWNQLFAYWLTTNSPHSLDTVHQC